MDETQHVRPLRRAAVLVSDLDRSLALYRDALGLAVWKSATGSGNDTFFRLLGHPPAEARFAILQADGSEIGMVGLFEIRNPSPPPLDRGDRAGVRIGEVALVFPTTDVDAVARRVSALGLPFLCPPSNFAVPGGGSAMAREMTFRDFDGALINLLQMLGPEGSRTG